MHHHMIYPRLAQQFHLFGRTVEQPQLGIRENDLARVGLKREQYRFGFGFPGNSRESLKNGSVAFVHPIKCSRGKRGRKSKWEIARSAMNFQDVVVSKPLVYGLFITSQN